jgi:cytochrome c-type biogenesis protein
MLTQPVSWGVLFAVFAGGLLSFFSPCVAPLAPGYIGYLSGRSLRAASIDESGAALSVRRSSWLVSALFIAGFSATFVSLGLLSGAFGRLLVAYRPVMETLAGIVMLMMGAFLLDLLPKNVTGLLMREGRLHLAPGATAGLGMAAPVALGAVFAAGWTPCVGPVLAPILAFVGASGNPPLGALLLAVYSLGFALPFLAIGFGWSASLKMNAVMKRYGGLITKISGVALLLVGIIYLTGHSQLFAVWAQQVALPSNP